MEVAIGLLSTALERPTMRSAQSGQAGGEVLLVVQARELQGKATTLARTLERASERHQWE